MTVNAGKCKSYKNNFLFISEGVGSHICNCRGFQEVLEEGVVVPIAVKVSLISTVKSDNKPRAYICSNGFFWWAYFRGGVFSERFSIGRNFAFQNGLGLEITTA